MQSAGERETLAVAEPKVQAGAGRCRRASLAHRGRTLRRGTPCRVRSRRCAQRARLAGLAHRRKGTAAAPQGGRRHRNKNSPEMKRRELLGAATRRQDSETERKRQGRDACRDAVTRQPGGRSAEANLARQVLAPCAARASSLFLLTPLHPPLRSALASHHHLPSAVYTHASSLLAPVARPLAHRSPTCTSACLRGLRSRRSRRSSRRWPHSCAPSSPATCWCVLPRKKQQPQQPQRQPPPRPRQRQGSRNRRQTWPPSASPRTRASSTAPRCQAAFSSSAHDTLPMSSRELPDQHALCALRKV